MGWGCCVSSRAILRLASCGKDAYLAKEEPIDCTASAESVGAAECVAFLSRYFTVSFVVRSVFGHGFWWKPSRISQVDFHSIRSSYLVVVVPSLHVKKFQPSSLLLVTPRGTDAGVEWHLWDFHVSIMLVPYGHRV